MQSQAATDFDQLADEHIALMRDYASAQVRCSAQLRSQAREIERLSAQAVRLRAAAIVRETALAWEREDRAALEAAIPGLPKRVTLARRIDALLARIQDLMRERLHWERSGRRSPPAAVPDPAVPRSDDPESLEASLGAADLVICQTGCLSHGAYWRVQDHCKRTGKACVLVEEPDALRIVRIHRAPEGQGRARIATLATEQGD
ncbi:DUF2325 domain-containing protein [Variovorax sp. OV329]|uniref:DUF2325 domain-containing protein n=1 Tax=Variovorax sp. OV329 TaxID=1882825 RepID=UPI0008E3B3DA|nr:DUF2325 domain-containing protein [Variovorax sp. OV329]SFM66242.1 hypothetical protein SAMN05444747_107209 [Variovorax sp. OV329]